MAIIKTLETSQNRKKNKTNKYIYIYIYIYIYTHTHIHASKHGEFNYSFIFSNFIFVNCLLEFPWGSDGKASACNLGDQGSIPGSGRSSGEGNGNPLQYSCLGNPTDREAWWATVQEVLEMDTTEHTLLPLPHTHLPYW